jgi:hypothetical protein
MSKPRCLGLGVGAISMFGANRNCHLAGVSIMTFAFGDAGSPGDGASACAIVS